MYLICLVQYNSKDRTSIQVDNNVIAMNCTMVNQKIITLIMLEPFS